MSEVDDIRVRFARQIEDGKRVLSFASTDEWGWYVDTVIQPTIDEYTRRMLQGTLPEREDMHIRGMIAGYESCQQYPRLLLMQRRPEVG
jgi:hypothetical protein